jgi:hypothetical protein
MKYQCKECKGVNLWFSVNATVDTDDEGHIDWDTVENAELDANSKANCRDCNKEVEVLEIPEEGD